MSADFVIDNSVVMSWCFRDETNRYADSMLDRLPDARVFVPSIWPLEVVNVLVVAERRRRLSEAGSVQFITLLSQLPIVVEQRPTQKVMKELLMLARSSSLSSYDASYLDLAMRKGLPLATLDNNLIAAAEAVGIEILQIPS